MPETLTEAELLTRALDSRLGEIHTALPGRVESYSRGANTVDVQPQVQINGETLPVIPTVPIIYLGGISSSIACNLQAGDTGLLIFCEADIGLWRQRAEIGAPADEGRHGIQGAVFIPGLRVTSDTINLPNGDAMVITSPDLRLGAESATEPVIKGTAYNTAILAWAGAVSAAITGVGGDVTTALANLTSALPLALSAKVKVD